MLIAYGQRRRLYNEAHAEEALMGKRTHVYIVGAGFSKYAGLPLQSNFTEALLAARDTKTHPMYPLTRHLARFTHDAFDHSESAWAKHWPNLEDLFTNIDLAANTGHHLGQEHSPSELRTTRRVLLARMMYMLNKRYVEAERNKSNEWKKLDRFFKHLDVDHSAFVSINWDTVIERRLTERRNLVDFDYGCGALAARFPNKGHVVAERRFASESKRMPVVKIHGSVNWLYCDNCRQLYWFPPDEAVRVAMQLITAREAKRLKVRDAEACERWRCPNCSSVPLTTRIATFSFLKALDFPMFEKSWVSAERLLRNANKWIFIGYSLPGADYEFKHLLKRVQLSRKKPPEFAVITGGSDADTDYTYMNYQRFFGRDIKKDIKKDANFFHEGLSEAAIKAATS
jgi:hypothetical protein